MIYLKTREEIELLRENNILVSRALAEVGRHIKPGITTRELNDIAEAYILGPDSECPGAVVVNVWDWDPQWKVEWSEDGVFVGAMQQVSVVSPVFASEIKAVYDAYGKAVPRWKSPKPSPHNFMAVPSPSARRVPISL